jgi:hypothetical protein
VLRKHHVFNPGDYITPKASSFHGMPGIPLASSAEW